MRFTKYAVITEIAQGNFTDQHRPPSYSWVLAKFSSMKRHFNCASIMPLLDYTVLHSKVKPVICSARLSWFGSASSDVWCY